MQHPYLFIVGTALSGMLIPEFFVMLSGGKAKAPPMMNFVSFVAAGLIAAAFALR